MKVLFSHNLPFFLAHGGSQELIKAVMRGLNELGAEAEPERWWDEHQRGDIIHYVGRPTGLNVGLAHQKGFKTVMTEFLDQTASRTPLQLFAQRTLTRVIRRTFSGFTNRMSWEVYGRLNAMIYCTQHEWEVAQYLFDAPADRGHFIPHGLEEDALAELSQPQAEEDYLISAATIIPRKNSVLLARAAHLAQVPIVFLGKPFSADDPYFLEFQKLVDNRFVRYPGFVSREEKHRLLRGARGFALLSRFESGCIALYEAAAAGLPLFLSDLPWASRAYEQARAKVLVKLRPAEPVARDLREFYDQAHRRPGMTFPIMSWREVAAKYLEIYRSVLGR